MSSPLKIYKPDELAALNLPPRKFILGGWLEERQPCMVYAQTGRGKSLFSMSLAIAIAGGGSVFGWGAPCPLAVLYVDAEMDLADIRDRQALLTSTVDNLDSEALNKNLHILPRHGHSNKTAFPDIIEEAGTKALLEEIDKIRPAIVILDNLSTLADIKDENDAASFNPIIHFLYKLRDRNCAVILVHHTGKKEGKFRGSSKLAATFESILQLAQNSELFEGDTGFAIKVDKFRGANQPDPIRVKLEVDESGSGRWSHEGLGHRELEELIAAAQSREFCFARDMVEHLGISQGEISKRRKKAIALGMITGDEWKQCFQDARDGYKEFGHDNNEWPEHNSNMEALNLLIDPAFKNDGAVDWEENDVF